MSRGLLVGVDLEGFHCLAISPISSGAAETGQHDSEIAPGEANHGFTAVRADSGFETERGLMKMG